MNKNHLNTNEELRQGEYLTCLSGEYKAVFEENSNFVIYNGSSVTWETNTSGSKGTRLVLQEDANLVMYTEYKQVVWASYSLNSQETDLCRLTLTDKGQLELERDGVQLWSSATSENWKPF